MPFKWTEECQCAFKELRRKLVLAPVLAFPDFSRRFILDTDASKEGIGAVLSQILDDGKEHPISYASRVLSKAERQYCVARKELLAVVHFTQHFCPYLLGRSFTLRTNHGSLTWLQNFKNPEWQLARWLEKLQKFEFEIVHRAGRIHSNADALSRRPCAQCHRESHQTAEVLQTGVESGTTPLAVSSASEVRKLQLEDGMLGPVLRALESNSRPSRDGLQGESL